MSDRTIKIVYNNMIGDVEIDGVKTTTIKSHGSPTSNCQMSAIQQFTNLLKELTVSELVTYINLQSFKLILITIVGKKYYLKFSEAIEKSNKSFKITKEFKYKGKYNYVCIIHK